MIPAITIVLKPTVPEVYPIPAVDLAASQAARAARNQHFAEVKARRPLSYLTPRAAGDAAAQAVKDKYFRKVHAAIPVDQRVDVMTTASQAALTATILNKDCRCKAPGIRRK